tara:strand:- start:243 stop:380 length:138 start_codon:yes stop_codon:yes gene_type:complete
MSDADLREAKELSYMEEIPFKEALDYVLRIKKAERLRKLNNRILN